jgi:hypothetical protein
VTKNRLVIWFLLYVSRKRPRNCDRADKEEVVVGEGEQHLEKAPPEAAEAWISPAMARRGLFRYLPTR